MKLHLPLRLQSKPTLVFGVVFLVAFTAATLVCDTFIRRRDDAARVQLIKDASSVADVLRSKFLVSLTKAETVAAALTNHSQIERIKVLESMGPLIRLDSRLLELISLATPVEDKHREAFEREVLVGAKIKSWTPEGPVVSPRRRSYTVVSSIYPLEGNEAALGFDLSSEPVRGKAIRDAMSSGLPQCSEPIVAVQDAKTDGASLSTLVVVPTKSSGQVDAFVTALLRFRLLSDAVRSEQSGCAVLAEILIESDSGAKRVWFDKDLVADAALQNRFPFGDGKHLIAHFADNRTTMIVPAYVLYSVGFIISFLLALLSAQHIKRISLIEAHRRELQQLAADLLGEVDEPSRRPR